MLSKPVRLHLRCGQCGAFFSKDVEAERGDIEACALKESAKTHLHKCSNGMLGIAQVRGVAHVTDGV